ncbi:hypothetical protein OROMI_031479 [Orobanche minor]
MIDKISFVGYNTSLKADEESDSFLGMEILESSDIFSSKSVDLPSIVALSCILQVRPFVFV